MSGFKYTDQEAFDISVNGVIKQGRQSESNAMCVYRNKNGMKCAAGHLIPDELYTAVFEGNAWSRLLLDYPILTTLAKSDLVRDLQSAHDNWAGQTVYFIDHFKIEARKIAERHNLIYTEFS